MPKGRASGPGEFVNFLSDVAEVVAQYVDPPLPVPGPSPEFTRRAFEMGTSNELAVRAADAVVSEPGVQFNPLLIHGPRGVGKTHLLHAIGNGLAAKGRHLVVVCVAAPALLEELAEAARSKTVPQWRQRYARVDALLLDDTQLLDERDAALQELRHLCDTLVAARRPLVLTSDRPLARLPELERQLRVRLAAGLVVEMQPPDEALRERLCARYLLATSAEREPELARALASRPLANAPEILALVTRLASAADAAGVRLTLDFARAQLDREEARGAATARGTEWASALDPRFLDRQRVVWDWPEAVGRVIEEWR